MTQLSNKSTQLAQMMNPAVNETWFDSPLTAYSDL